MRALYTLLLYAALPWILARLWWRGRREPGYREGLADSERRARMGLAGMRLCARHRGAAERHLAACRGLLTARERG